MTTANVGTIDRVARVALGAALIGLAYFTDTFSSETANLIALIVGGVLVATAIVSLCPLYRILGLGTVTKN